MWKSVKLLGVACLLGTAVLLACLVLLTKESKAGGEVLCVVPPGEPTGPFAACAAVFTQIQQAVDTAVGGEEIWVAAGVYTDVHTIPSHAWTQQIVLITKTLTLRGGYVAPFTEPPDFVANPTILDAQGQGGVFVVANQRSTIEGLHLTGGVGQGGGIYIIEGATVTLSQNFIYGNTSVGAILVHSSQATIDQNTIHHNVAEAGAGGILLYRSQVMLSQNMIHNNIGAISGTGTYEAISGGGIYIRESQAVLTGNSILSNTAVLTLTGGEASGGGIYARDSYITMTANVVNGNVAAAVMAVDVGWVSKASGGGIAVENSSITVLSNTIAGNTALGTATESANLTLGVGGGMFVGGSQGIISHNFVISNHAVAQSASYGEGGGLMIHGTALTVTGNTIEGNVALGNCVFECSEGLGGGLYLGLGNDSPVTAVVTLRNNEIQNNVAAVSGIYGIGGGLFVYGSFNDSLSTAHLADNDILGNTGIISGLVGAGGGLFIGVEEATITLTENWVMSNTAAMTATIYGAGGGLFVRGGQQQFSNNRITHNEAAQNGNGYGGGLATGSYGHVQMVNTILNDNRANTNGSALAMVFSEGNLSMFHSTIAQNQSNGAAVWLAAEEIEGGEPATNSRLTMTNTILVSHTTAVSVNSGNTATLNGVLWFNTPVTVTAGVTATVNISHQLTGDPVFVADGYHITAGSAVIRAGVLSGIPLDIDGEGRPFTNPSLGADEYWPFKRYFPVVFRP